jgi:rhodanese-related sulfurtransferase
MIDSQQLVLNALTKIEEISVNELSLIKDGAKLIDIREHNEIEEGVIPESIWIPRGLLEFQILALVEQFKWNIDEEIYLYCRSGNRSALAGEALLEMGFKKPISVAGGFTAWRDSGFSVGTNILHF